MVKIAWNAFKDATCTSFTVYRSIPGITVLFPNALASGDVLTFAATSVDVQNVTIVDPSIDAVISQFNTQAKGAYAIKDTGGTKMLIRTTATSKAKLKLYPCTFLTHTSQAVRILVPALEWVSVSTVTFVSATFSYNFTDPDGTELDSYRVTSTASAVESLPSIVETPKIGTDSLCAIEGRVCDSQNRPIVGMLVRAQPRTPEAYSDGHGVDVHTVQSYTDGYGRFSLYLSRKGIYLFQIPNVGYNEAVCVPDLPAAGFIDLIPTLAGRFSPFGDPE